jgi:exodeoxyribonuclease V beta subunit
MTPPSTLNPAAFPLHGSRLIEASAGTGKTWTIAALYVRLVLGHGADGVRFPRPLLPTEILVVTFTEAATGELRDRIRARLSEAARVFRGQDPGDDFLRGLAAGYRPNELAACARRLEVAAEWMDEAAVFTIHGWCNRMLRQHAFQSGTLFDLEVGAGGGDLLAESVRDYWRTFFSALDAPASAAVARVAASPEALLGKLRSLLAETLAEWWVGGAPAAVPESPLELLNAWGEWEAERARLESEARAAWRADRAAIEMMLREALANKYLSKTSYPPASFEDRLAALADWAERGAECNPKWRNSFAEGRFKLNKGGLDNPPRHSAFGKLASLAGHLETEPDLGPGLLSHATGWVRERYAREKQRRSKMDFDDLPRLLDSALSAEGGASLAACIRGQFPVALIDEFQDTDPLQYRIFDAVYRIGESPDDLGCFLIGDPKQAIYSFRGADLHTYLKARAATAGRHYTLGRNFRSTKELVAAVNRVFGHADGFPEGAFRFRNGSDDPIPYLPVDAAGRDEALVVEGSPAPALTLWHLEAEAPLSLTAYRETLAEAAATAVVRLLNLGARGRAGFEGAGGRTPLRPADFAVLVKDRMEAEAMRLALAARGVRSVYLSLKDSVYATAEAADLLFWLRAVAEPERDRTLRAALATGTLALSYARLDELGRDELQWEAETERFRGYRRLWRRQGVLPMLYRLLRDFEVPARLLARADSGGERTLTNLLHLAELLQAASAGLDGEMALVRFLSEAVADAENGDEEHLLRLESDAGLVKIVTVHKSKGLEYPLVFLPFACSFREANGKAGHYRYHDEAGRLRIDFDLGDDARARADRERLQEDLRLLYVALTRARHACWVGIAPVKSGNVKQCQLDKSAVGYVLAGSGAVDAAGLAAALEALRGGCAGIAVTPTPEAGDELYRPAGAAPALVPAREFRGQPPERWWIASYSALRFDRQGQVPGPEPAEPEAADTALEENLLAEAGEAPSAPAVLTARAGSSGGLHEFPQGANPGVFLHGLLEWAAREGFAKAAADAAKREDTIARRCQNRGWQRWIEPLDRWLAETLGTPLPLPEGTVQLQRLTAYQPELEFWFAAEGVDTLALDRLVSRSVLPGRPRPKLAEDRLNGMLKGFIDLAFELDGRYYLLDYKSNKLGPDGAAYTREAMAAAVLEHRYDLQYSLYLLALHRQLRARLGPAYDYARHVGGVAYLFLRGLDGPTRGMLVDCPPESLVEGLDRLFGGEG